MWNELEGLTEATTAPSAHRCGWKLVDFTLQNGEWALACYSPDCNLVWHTGVITKSASVVKLVRAADVKYGGEAGEGIKRCTRCNRSNVEFERVGVRICRHCRRASNREFSRTKRLAA